MAKLTYHTRVLTPSSISWSAGVLTINFSGNHLLLATDAIHLEWQDIGKALDTTVASAPSVTQITVAMTDRPSSLNIVVFVRYFSTGYTGGLFYEGVQCSLGKPLMVQSYVVGTGGASYSLEVSLDGVHWVAVATVTHTTADGNTSYVIVDPIVNFVRANVASVGASTKLVVMHAS